MEAETRMATARQLAYIERLGADTRANTGKPIGELTLIEASELIADLLQKANVGQNGKEGANGKSPVTIPVRKTDFGSGARVGMAFKCVYRNWVPSGVNIFKNKKEFIKNVLDTYRLIRDRGKGAGGSQRLNNFIYFSFKKSNYPQFPLPNNNFSATKVGPQI